MLVNIHFDWKEGPRAYRPRGEPEAADGASGGGRAGRAGQQLAGSAPGGPSSSIPFAAASEATAARSSSDGQPPHGSQSGAHTARPKSVKRSSERTRVSTSQRAPSDPARNVRAAPAGATTTSPGPAQTMSEPTKKTTSPDSTRYVSCSSRRKSGGMCPAGAVRSTIAT